MKINFVQPLWHQRVIELGVGLLLCVSAILMMLLPINLIPQCGFASRTGLPCLSCGTTRCLDYLARGDLANAFMMQPLFFVFAGFFAVWLLYTLLATAFKWPALRLRLESRREVSGALVLAALLILVNWTYLLFTQ